MAGHRAICAFLAITCLAVSIGAAKSGAEAAGATALLGGSVIDLQAVPFRLSALATGGLDGTGGRACAHGRQCMHRQQTS